MATPVAEQAILLAKSKGIDAPSADVIATYSRMLAKTSLIVVLGPVRNTLRGDASDAREFADERDYDFFRQMLDKTAIAEFFEHQAWGPHRVLMDTVMLDTDQRAPAYRVFWNERQRFLADYDDLDAFKATLEPMVASVSMLLGVEWADWMLDVGQ
jgi:hypothetical protein